MDYIVVGKIINTHGIKGEIKLYPYTDNIKRFSDLDEIYLGKNKLSVKIQSVRYHKEMVLLKFEGYDNINDVIILKDEFVFINKVDRIKLPKNKYFIYELIDCKVLDTDGNLIGYVKDVLKNSSNDVYIVKNEDKEYLIPAVKEFVKEINLGEQKIIIDPIEGMIE